MLCIEIIQQDRVVLIQLIDLEGVETIDLHLVKSTDQVDKRSIVSSFDYNNRLVVTLAVDNLFLTYCLFHRCIELPTPEYPSKHLC